MSAPITIDLGEYDHETQLVLVLKRYDDGPCPWGVHLVTFNVAAWPPLTHQPVGLFTAEQVADMIEQYGFGEYMPGDAMETTWQETGVADPIGVQILNLLDDYIWSLVVPMEWHGKRDDLHMRVMLMHPYGMGPYHYADLGFEPNERGPYAFVGVPDRLYSSGGPCPIEMVELPPMPDAG